MESSERELVKISMNLLYFLALWGILFIVFYHLFGVDQGSHEEHEVLNIDSRIFENSARNECGCKSLNAFLILLSPVLLSPVSVELSDFVELLPVKFANVSEQVLINQLESFLTGLQPEAGGGDSLLFSVVSGGISALVLKHTQNLLILVFL